MPCVGCAAGGTELFFTRMMRREDGQLPGEGITCALSLLVNQFDPSLGGSPGRRAPLEKCIVAFPGRQCLARALFPADAGAKSPASRGCWRIRWTSQGGRKVRAVTVQAQSTQGAPAPVDNINAHIGFFVDSALSEAANRMNRHSHQHDLASSSTATETGRSHPQVAGNQPTAYGSSLICPLTRPLDAQNPPQRLPAYPDETQCPGSGHFGQRSSSEVRFPPCFVCVGWSHVFAHWHGQGMLRA